MLIVVPSHMRSDCIAHAKADCAITSELVMGPNPESVIHMQCKARSRPSRVLQRMRMIWTQGAGMSVGAGMLAVVEAKAGHKRALLTIWTEMTPQQIDECCLFQRVMTM